MHGGLLLSRVVVLPGGLREYTKQTAQAQVLTLQKSSGSRSRLKACQLARHWGLSPGDDTMLGARDISPLTGLSEAEAAVRLKGEGRNELPSSKPRSIFSIACDVVREPMFLLLVACGAIYLVLGAQIGR